MKNHVKGFVWTRLRPLRLLGRLGAPLLWCSAGGMALAQPAIARQPASLSLSIGATAIFRVVASTTHGPMTYQRSRQETPLLDATNATLTLTNIQMADAGAYAVAVTDAGGTTNSALATLDVDPTWTKITSDLFVTDPGPEWSTAAWADLDNDGFLDLFVSRGLAGNRLYRNNGDGTFTRIDTGPGAYTGYLSAGCDWGDYDNDGFLDLFVVNTAVQDPPASQMNNFLNHNNGNTNRWLKVRLEGTVSNRAAIGAKVRVLASLGGTNLWQLREISVGCNFSGHNLLPHFGLRDAQQADVVRIEWPSGVVQELRDVPANQTLAVTEPPKLVAIGLGAFHIQSWKGMVFEVQCFIDLDSWQPIKTLTNLTGTLTFADVAAPQSAACFYRVVKQ